MQSGRMCGESGVTTFFSPGLQRIVCRAALMRACVKALEPEGEAWGQKSQSKSERRLWLYLCAISARLAVRLQLYGTRATVPRLTVNEPVRSGDGRDGLLPCELRSHSTLEYSDLRYLSR